MAFLNTGLLADGMIIDFENLVIYELTRIIAITGVRHYIVL